MNSSTRSTFTALQYTVFEVEIGPFRLQRNVLVLVLRYVLLTMVVELLGTVVVGRYTQGVLGSRSSCVFGSKSDSRGELWGVCD